MDQLIAVLEATLSADPNQRIGAELRLQELYSASETALGLSQVAVEPSVALHLRQISLPSELSISEESVLHFLQRSERPLFALKKYVREEWSPIFPTFKGPEATTVEVKSQVRALIFGGLADPVRKIRLAAAAIISDIAHPDWPDDWPTLMNQLLSLVASPQPDAVDGAMRVLAEFVRDDLTEDQLLPVAKEMLPCLLNILGSADTHSPSTRARTINIFRQCVMTLFTVKDEHPASVKAAVAEILPQWLQAFAVLLQQDLAAELNSGSWDGLAIRTAIFSALSVCAECFPSAVKTSLPSFLELTNTQLALALPVYHEAFLSSTSDFDVPVSEDEDASQVPSDLPGFVSTVFEFLAGAVRLKAAKKLYISGKQPTELLQVSMESVMAYGQMTTDDEEEWATNPNAFVADEDDEAAAYNVRAAANDFTIAMVETFGEPTLGVLYASFERRAALADQTRASGDADWWKRYEAALALIGTLSEDLIDHFEECREDGKAPLFNLERLFTSVVPGFLTGAEFPFLQGRSFVFASQFASSLPAELATQYIDAAIQVLDAPEAGVPVKVSAVRALNNFFRHLKLSLDATRAVQTLARLLPLVGQTNENTQVLVIEAVRSAVKVGAGALDAGSCKSLVETILGVWLGKPEDPLLGSAICEVFDSLSSTASAVVEASIINDAFPSLTAAMLQVRHDRYSTSAASATDIVDALFAGRPAPLAAGWFAAVAPTLFEVLSITDDRDVLQAGLNIITTTVRKDVSQLLQWRNAQGQGGLELVLNIVARMLDPKGAEAGGLFVGDLVLHLIRKAGSSVGPVLPGLLQAFVTRLATAETASFSQSLILPFAYLLQGEEGEQVLGLLEGIRVEGGKAGEPARSGLEVLLASWCENVDFFQGYWNLKVSTVALTRLFLAARPSLAQVQVKGDLKITEANKNTIMTRARARANPHEFPPIPFPLKALKLLLKDAASLAPKASGANLDDAVSDDGEDDEWEDDGAEFTAAGNDDLDFLSEMMGPGGALAGYGDDGSDFADEDEEDDDLKEDPIFVMDLPAHLKGFFQGAYAHDSNSFKHWAEQLNDEEKNTLGKVLQSA